MAAVAFLVDSKSRLNRALLWNPIRAGSWVTPQLIVAAMYTDPEFSTNAIACVERNGPSNGKLVASVLGLRSMVPAIDRRANAWGADPELVGALETDAAWDRSDAIAVRWAIRIREICAEHGIRLQSRG